MSTIQQMGISGIRSFSDNQVQRIKFLHPLTLIWGKNGSGKTTIIQCLRYMLSGQAPPSSEKGKHFILDPTLVDKLQVIGNIRLKFRIQRGLQIQACKIAKVRQASGRKGLQFKSLQQILSLQDNGVKRSINHQCTQMQKTIPLLLGVSRHIIQKIIFCHQEQSLWPFSDNVTLKSIFDELFDTSHIVKITKNITQIQKKYISQLQLLENRAKQHKQFLYEKLNQRKRANCNVQLLMNNIKQILDLKSYPGIAQAADKGMNNKQYTTMQILNRLKQLYSLLGNQNNLNIDKKLQRLDIKSLQKQQQKIKEEQAFLQKQLSNIQKQKNNYETWIKVFMLAQHNQQKHKKKILELLGQDQITDFPLMLQNKIKLFRNQKNKLPQLQNQYKQIHQQKISFERYQKIIAKQQQLKIRQQKFKIQINKILKISLPLLNGFQQILSTHLPQTDMPTFGLNNTRAKTIIRQYKQLQNELKQMQKTRDRYSYAHIELQEDINQYVRQRKKCGMCNISIDSGVFISSSQTKIKKAKKDLDKIDLNIIQKEEQLRLLQGEHKKAIVYTYLDEIRIKGEGSNKINSETHTQIVLAINRFRQLLQQIQQINIVINTKAYDQNKVSLKQLKQFIQIQKQLKRFLKGYQQTNFQLTQLAHQRQSSKPHTHHHQSHYQQIITSINSIQKIPLQQLNTLKKLYQRQAQQINQSIKNLPQNYDQNVNENDIKYIKERLIGLKQSLQNIKQALKIKRKNENYDSLVRQRNELQTRLECMQYEDNASKRTLQLKYKILSKTKQIKTIKDNIPQSDIEQKIKRYISILTQRQIKQLAIQQLKQYKKSLETTLLIYHQQKMQQINRIIHDIWQQIYTGQDMSTIQIKSQEDITAKKNYIYRLIFKTKKGKQLEMKGRCSLGQKVLASLVVRLALAQAFGGSCGIFALDQPTTNLDKLHIIKLAQQLNQLIINRKNNSNFQLIIITHDQQFVKLLGHHAEYGYQVVRDADGFSKIKLNNHKSI